MKKFLLISDFDGTMTQKDFYWILLEDYIGQEGIDYYHQWKKKKKIGTEFLNEVFAWHRFTPQEHDEALKKVHLDTGVAELKDLVERQGGDFCILSAGFSYYIKKSLKDYGMDDVMLYTNEGKFEDGFFKMLPDQSSPYYSEVYGIDKGKVLLAMKEKYETVWFIGDSEPDLHAAVHADRVFAKNELQELMASQGMSYTPYKNFKDIIDVFKSC